MAVWGIAYIYIFSLILLFFLHRRTLSLGSLSYSTKRGLEVPDSEWSRNVQELQSWGLSSLNESHRVCVLVTRSCLTFCDLMDCSPPDSSVRGILQARILEWVAISFSRGSSQPRDWTRVSHVASRFFTIWATREAWGCGHLPADELSSNVCISWQKGGVVTEGTQGPAWVRTGWIAILEGPQEEDLIWFPNLYFGCKSLGLTSALD